MKLSHKHKHHMSTKNPSILRKTSEAIITFMSNMRAQDRERARGCKKIINQSSARFFRLPPLHTKNILSLFLFRFSAFRLVPLHNMIRWKF